MRTGLAFTTELTILPPPCHIIIDLFGSLGVAGRDHLTDRAVLLGLVGYDPETVDISTVEPILPALASIGMLTLSSGAQATLDVARDTRFVACTVLPYHVNTFVITAADTDTHIILWWIYCPAGDGLVIAQTNDGIDNPEVLSLASGQTSVGINIPAPYSFIPGNQPLAQCDVEGKSIAELVRANEEAVCPRETLDIYLGHIADTVFDCVDAGTSAAGILPGGLDAPRHARALAGKLARRLPGPSTLATAETGQGGRGDTWAWVSTTADPIRVTDWINLFALVVNEKNAAGHRVVTAPTNGMAGIIPAVLGYFVARYPETGSAPGVAAGPDARDGSTTSLFHIRLTDSHAGATHEDCDDDDEETFREHRHTLVHDNLLTTTAIGILIRASTSIAGAKVDCQGKVGSASAMAAAGLAQALGGNPRQVENAAEVAMKYSLGLTCDPVAGLIQVPYIERNAIAAAKTINAVCIVLWGDGRHIVSLSAVIETTRQTDNDIFPRYKETSEGELAVNVVEH